MPLTLKEIAKELSLSTATVSRALNGKAGISEETRRLVLDWVNERHYTPNRLAQGLATAQTFAVAFVIRRSLVGADNPFYDRIMRGVERELEQFGYHLVAITIDETQLASSRLAPGLDRRRLDGLIVAGCELSDAVMDRLVSLGIPVVLAANRHQRLTVDVVTSANRRGGYAAARHLIEHGHQHIVFLSGPTQWAPVRERLLGYQEALQEAGLTPHVIYRADLEIATGYSALHEAVQQLPQLTAVFAASDPMAIGALRAARETGRRPPDDLALIGFDNIPWSESTEPPLTTLYIHKTQIGRLAARRLLDIIREGPLPAVEIEVENELVIRRSCGCGQPVEAAPPTDHRQVA